MKSIAPRFSNERRLSMRTKDQHCLEAIFSTGTNSYPPDKVIGLPADALAVMVFAGYLDNLP
jgi:hypothetical protein